MDEETKGLRSSLIATEEQRYDLVGGISPEIAGVEAARRAGGPRATVRSHCQFWDEIGCDI